MNPQIRVHIRMITMCSLEEQVDRFEQEEDQSPRKGDLGSISQEGSGNHDSWAAPSRTRGLEYLCVCVPQSWECPLWWGLWGGRGALTAQLLPSNEANLGFKLIYFAFRIWHKRLQTLVFSKWCWSVVSLVTLLSGLVGGFCDAQGTLLPSSRLWGSLEKHENYQFSEGFSELAWKAPCHGTVFGGKLWQILKF